MMSKKGKKHKAALAMQKPDVNLQAGPRSAQSATLNYRSVNTLDPSRLAVAFALADQGHIHDQAALFELVEEQDAHIYSELAKRRRAVTGLGWSLTPPMDATQAEIDATFELEQMTRAIPRIKDAQYDLTDAIGKGFVALEIDWMTGGTWLPRALNFVPQRLFRLDAKTGELQLTKPDTGTGEALRPGGWIIHEHRAKSGYIEQSALFRVLAWTYAYKAYDVRDMQRFLETYGLPLRLGKFPPGISKEQRNELLRAVRNIGNDGAGVVPSNMSIDFIQATKTGEVNDFLSAIEYWERKQSMAILGGTLTSQADGKTSTNALGAVHNEVRKEIMLHDVRQLEPTISNQLIAPVALINGMFGPDRLPKFAYHTGETVDLRQMVEVLEKAAGMGMEIDVDYAHNTLQIPRAGKGALILGAKNSPAAGGAALKRTAAAQQQGNDAAGAFSAQMAAAAAPFEQAMMQQVAAILAEHGDFDAAIAAMEKLDFGSQEYVEQLALGLAAANLAGRAEVGNG